MQIAGCFARGTSASTVFVIPVSQKPSHLHLGFTLVLAVNVTLASTISKTQEILTVTAVSTLLVKMLIVRQMLNPFTRRRGRRFYPGEAQPKNLERFNKWQLKLLRAEAKVHKLKTL